MFALKRFKSFTGFVVGTAFFVQANNFDLTFNNAASAYHAPKRQAEEYTYCVEISREGASRYDNRVFVRASEDAESTFVQGKDEYTLNGTTSNYGALLFVLAPGAFIVLGYLIAIVNKLRNA